MIDYKPKIFEQPKVITVRTAWIGLEKVIKDIIVRFNLNTDIALEFGVERGYSTTALSNYFKDIIGVDIFNRGVGFTYPEVKEALKDWKNIYLVEQRFEDYIKHEIRHFDLIHIDIIHEYKPTYDCGEWSVQHSDCVIFHDTLSFPAVKKACEDLALKYNLEFYNYNFIHGLGILIKK